MKIDGRTLEAEVEGMICTNGIDTHGSTIYLGDSLNPKDFYEITVEEYERILAEEAEKQNNI